jgi:hypothetical protein
MCAVRRSQDLKGIEADRVSRSGTTVRCSPTEIGAAWTQVVEGPPATQVLGRPTFSYRLVGWCRAPDDRPPALRYVPRRASEHSLTVPLLKADVANFHNYAARITRNTEPRQPNETFLEVS